MKNDRALETISLQNSYEVKLGVCECGSCKKNVNKVEIKVFVERHNLTKLSLFFVQIVESLYAI